MIGRWCVCAFFMMVASVQAQFEPEVMPDSMAIVLAPELSGSLASLESGDVGDC